MGSPVLKTFPHSCEGMFFALSSSKTTSGSCRQRKYSIGRNKNLCARRSSFPGSWLLPKTLRTNILQCFFSAGSKIPFSQLFHHSCNRISLCLFLREIIFKHKYTQMTYTWKQLLWSLKLISLGTSCVSICYNISCGASVLTSQIHAATFQFTIIQCAHFGCMPKKVVHLHVPYEPKFVEKY